jgi:membrane dipeptidase
MPRKNIAGHAAELHAQALVIDAHSDILMALADGKMRLGDRVTVPDPATWEPPAGLAEQAKELGWSPHSYCFASMGQYDIPRLTEGGVTLQVCAMYLRDAELDRALQRGLDMTWSLHREARDNPQFEVITTVEQLRRVKAERKVAGLLAFEGLEPLGYELRYLDLWYQMGLRMASLTHNRRNAFGDGWQPGVKVGGLTDLGKRAVRRMNELGIVVDLGHMNQAGFWDLMEIHTGPIIVSHTSPRALFPQWPEDSIWHPVRDVSRGQERLDLICRTGGVIGVIGFEGGLDRVISEIEYLLEHAGPDHIGLGTDFCGFDTCTKDFCEISQLPRVTERLVERGHSDEVILKILGENFVRVFEQVWKA